MWICMDMSTGERLDEADVSAASGAREWSRTDFVMPALQPLELSQSAQVQPPPADVDALLARMDAWQG